MTISMMESVNHSIEARDLVERYVSNVLYPHDTPEFEVDILLVVPSSRGWVAFLVTTIPDDLMYHVAWSPSGKPTLTVYKKLEAE